jgi:hypothetical protein
MKGKRTATAIVHYVCHGQHMLARIGCVLPDDNAETIRRHFKRHWIEEARFISVFFVED